MERIKALIQNLASPDLAIESIGGEKPICNLRAMDTTDLAGEI